MTNVVTSHVQAHNLEWIDIAKFHVSGDHTTNRVATHETSNYMNHNGECSTRFSLPFEMSYNTIPSLYEYEFYDHSNSHKLLEHCYVWI